MCQFTLESSGTIYLLEVSPNFTLHVMYMHSQDVRHLCWNLRGARAVWVEQERKGSSDQPLSFVVESFFFFPLFLQTSGKIYRSLGGEQKESCDFAQAKIASQSEHQAVTCHRSGLLQGAS